MKFYIRLAYYLSGFAIGMVFLFFILNGKDTGCSYFPNARVLKYFRTVPFKYSDLAKQKLAEKWVDTSDIRKTLTYGDVDFDRSNVKTKHGQLYIVYGKTAKDEPITLELLKYTTQDIEKAMLMDIRRKNK